LISAVFLPPAFDSGRLPGWLFAGIANLKDRTQDS
jgi:hypothetical protein